MLRTQIVRSAIAASLGLLFLSALLMTSFLASVKADVSEIDNALNNGILYLESVQSSYGHEGEFATYRWAQSDQSDKEYIHTMFTTPFVLHTLNYLAFRYEYLAEVGTLAFENMRSVAATHLLDHMETKDGHTGVWRFYPDYPQYPLFPPDFCDTCCNLECLLSYDPSLWADTISNDLTDYFLEYRRPSGAFQTWIIPMNTDVCCNTNANVMFFYASRNEEHRIQTTMDYLNNMIDNMLLGLPYDAVYYRSPYAFTYLSSRAYRDGGAEALLSSSQREAMRNYILADQEADGSWPKYPQPGYLGPEDELETALALVSLINLGFSELTSSEQDKVEEGIEYLLNTQNLDGSWPCAVFYVGPPVKIYYGSEEVTTALCMEALAKFPGIGVGGIWIPIDKFGLLAPYIGVASTILVATATTAIYVKRVTRRKKKQ
jgi:prenyltransferase beta subunit